MTTITDDPRDAAIGYRLFDRLEATNAELHAAQLRLATAKATIKTIERRIEECTADLRLDVSAVRGTDGKAAYGNAEARDAALLAAQRGSSEYRRLESDLSRAQRDYAEAQVAFDDANRSRQDTHLFMQWLAAYLRNTAHEGEA